MNRYGGKYQKTRHPGIFKYVGGRGEVYGIDYYAGGKKHREIVGPLLGEAQKKLAERKDKKGRPISLVALKRKTFNNLADEYEKNSENDPYFRNTRKYYVKILQDHFGETRLREIGTLELDKLKTQRKSTLTRFERERSDIAVNRELQTLNHMFNKAVLWGWMERNPFKDFRDGNGKDTFFYDENGRLRFLDTKEIKSLIDALDKKPERNTKGRGGGARKSPKYLKNIIKAAILTGMRKTDLLNLKWSGYKHEKLTDENGNEHEIRKLYFYEKKKKKWTDKVLNNDMIALLESIPRGESEYIFTGSDGKPIKSLQRSFRTVLKRAGIKDFRFHDLRHTSASYLMMRGASLKSVQEHLGHTTLKMTERYAHLNDQFQRDEVNRLNGLLPFPTANSKNLVRSWEKESHPISEVAGNA
ncbi:MAG: site-specific integrase [Proteobacteria bacterium]|nr:site-specific integrase [Pseudomonadota bacterium]